MGGRSDIGKLGEKNVSQRRWLSKQQQRRGDPTGTPGLWSPCEVLNQHWTHCSEDPGHLARIWAGTGHTKPLGYFPSVLRSGHSWALQAFSYGRSQLTAHKDSLHKTPTQVFGKITHVHVFMLIIMTLYKFIVTGNKKIWLYLSMSSASNTAGV